MSESSSQYAVSWLFVPGDRPDRFVKATGSGADEVICDLEDAVTEESKSIARQHVARWLASGGAAWVRLNATSTVHYLADVDALSALPGLRGVIVPKAEDESSLAALHKRLGTRTAIIPLIETAVGIQNAPKLAASRAVCRLAFGSVDFATDIGAAHDHHALLFARSVLVIASRAAGIAAPLDGVTTRLDDPSVAAADARQARRLGFGGKLCIHPAQVSAVAAAFQPTDREVAESRAIIETAERHGSAGAARHDGHMIDKASIERARRVVAQNRPGQPTGRG
jgi:citrate lyase subunit beta / citryl-CoA lyase